jgi:hypothetical protein
MARAHEKTGLVTKEQIEDFARDSSDLKGLETSKEFCRKHPLEPSNMSWFKDEVGRLYAVYFLLKDVWRLWPWMCPATTPEPVATAQEPVGSPAEGPTVGETAGKPQARKAGVHQSVRPAIISAINACLEAGTLKQEELEPGKAKLTYKGLERRLKAEGFSITAGIGTYRNAVRDVLAAIAANSIRDDS